MENHLKKGQKDGSTLKHFWWKQSWSCTKKGIGYWKLEKGDSTLKFIHTWENTKKSNPEDSNCHWWNSFQVTKFLRRVCLEKLFLVLNRMYESGEVASYFVITGKE